MVAYNQLQSLFAPDSHIAGDLLISPDSKGTDCVSGLSIDRLLSCQLLQHLKEIAVLLITCTQLPCVTGAAPTLLLMLS